ncbi:hypothetical protein C8Q78DRAFT_981976 [Trametes maxima]|nr:hypothetical protein C8Q78DRAFT_981976 [Trametes maxima]
MSDDLFGACFSTVFICCLEVCSGICNDFWSVRHTCIERTCTCRDGSYESDPNDPRERERLLENVEPRPHPPIQKPDAL